MHRVAVLSYSPDTRMRLCRQLGDHLARMGYFPCLEAPEELENFYYTMRTSPPDGVVLAMDGVAGLNAVEHLRRLSPDCVLVFTTTSTDHALDGYRVRALQYLVKPYQIAEVEEVLEEVLSHLPPEEAVIRLHIGRQERLLAPGEILWADHFRHQIHIHLRDGTETAVRMTFGEFTELLKEERRFLVCGRGVLVNLEHVRDFDGAAFLLNDGTQVPVSRSSTESARAAFGEFLFRRGATR